MVFNAAFNNISDILWQSFLCVEETGVPGELPPTCLNSFIKSIKKPVRAQNYRHLHFTLTMILMISNIYDIYKKNKNKYR